MVDSSQCQCSSGRTNGEEAIKLQRAPRGQAESSRRITEMMIYPKIHNIFETRSDCKSLEVGGRVGVPVTACQANVFHANPQVRSGHPQVWPLAGLCQCIPHLLRCSHRFVPLFFSFCFTCSRTTPDALLFFGVTAGKPPDPNAFVFEFKAQTAMRYLSLEPTYLAEQWAWNIKV